MKKMFVLAGIIVAFFLFGCIEQPIPEECASITTLKERDECILRVAVLEQDPFLCYNIQDEETKELCFSDATTPEKKKAYKLPPKKGEEPPPCLEAGESCTEDGECCSGYCDPATSKCVVPCSKLGEECGHNTDCCSGLCSKNVCVACLELEEACTEDGDCCSGYCVRGMCSAEEELGKELNVSKEVREALIPCEKEKDATKREECISGVAFSEKEIILCTLIGDSDEKNSCINEVATTVKDPAICDVLEGDERNLCILYSMG